MFGKLPIVYEQVDQSPHKEYQSVNTSVAEYLRKYGQGKIDSMPTDTRPEITDSRTTDEMLDDPNPEPGIGYDELDAIQELNRMKQRFIDAVAAIDITAKQKKAFDDAIAVLRDDNAPADKKREAYEVLQELERKGKITSTRVRD